MLSRYSSGSPPHARRAENEKHLTGVRETIFLLPSSGGRMSNVLRLAIVDPDDTSREEIKDHASRDGHHLAGSRMFTV